MIIRSFKAFESGAYLETHEIIDHYYLRDCHINEDGTVSADGNIEFFNIGIDRIPLKFRKVKGEFSCSLNRLKSLDGCPEIVGSRFYCRYNQLTSLVGGPQSVGGDYAFDHNRITSFEGFPEIFHGDIINCSHNPVFEIYKLCPNKDFVEALNEYQVIRGNKVVETRLRQALADAGRKRFPKIMNISGYELV